MVLVGVYIIVIVSDWQLGDNYELTSQKYYPLSDFLLRQTDSHGLVQWYILGPDTTSFILIVKRPQ